MAGRNSITEYGAVGVLVLGILLPFTIIGTWINNVIDLTQCDFEPDYKCEVLHGVGLIPAVSLITSFIDDDVEAKARNE